MSSNFFKSSVVINLKIIVKSIGIFLFIFWVREIYAKNLLVSKLIEQALKAKIYKSDTWKALLHYDEKSKKSYITDPEFILSSGNFSLKNELIKTIEAFFDSPSQYQSIDDHPICRFPARLLFLKHELSLKDSTFPSIECPEFKKYLEKAPADEIYLVFASEDIKSPSSMMGHVFFKIAGIDYRKKYVEHAISYYTVIDTYNPIVLALKSLFIGMPGFFSLTPYQRQLIKYLEHENRNIWEYRLKLDSYRKKLLYYHIWELKFPKLKYYFQGYNCATVVYYILAVAEHRLLKEKPYWVAPKDVLKKAYKYNLIEKADLLPSDQWFIKTLKDQLSFKDQIYIKNVIFKKKFEDLRTLNVHNPKDYYKLTLAEVYAYYLFKKNKLSKQEFLEVKEIVADVSQDCEYTIDISNYKSPIKTPDESQMGIGFRRLSENNFVKLYFLPISHTLLEDNRQYFFESSLKVGEISLLLNQHRVIVESFKFYSMTSLVPFDLFIKNLSSRFSLGIDQRYENNLHPYTVLNLEFGLGISYKIIEDLLVFGLGNFEGGYGNKAFYGTFSPIFGFSIYEIFDMKTVFLYRYWTSPFNYSQFQLYQVFFVKKRYKLSFGIDLIKNKENQMLNYEILGAIYF